MSEPTQQTQSRRRVTEMSQAMTRNGRKSAIGWLWVGMIALGLVGVLMVGSWSQQERLSVGRTATVIAEAQAGMQALTAQADAVERGEQGSLGKMQQARSDVLSALTVLKTGGYAAPGDPVAVMPLQGNNSVPLPAVEQALSQFDQASRVLVENAGLLERAGAAEAALAPAIAGASSSIALLSKRPSFSQGVWMAGIEPLRMEWTRPELQTMPIVFAPLDGASELQQQWAQRFKSQADEASRLATLAARDARVSAQDRAELENFSKQVSTVASSAATLSESTPVRLRVKVARQQWKAPLSSGQAALDQAGSVVFAMAKGRGWGTYAAWLMGLLGVVGLIMLARDWSRNQRTATLVSQESVVVQHGQEQMDLLVRQLRRIVPGDSPIQRGMRLHEEPESAAFPVASMVNRILDTFDKAEDDLRQQAADIDLALASGMEAGKNLSTQAQRHRQSIVQTETAVMDLAKQAASLAKRGLLLQQGLEACSDNLRQTASVMQQGMFKGDALRENTQDSAKRIKRLSESAQTISMAVDVIYGIIEQVQVLSMNVAIEAANAGEQGRNFVVISQEIQRLVTKGTSAAQQIDKIIETILTDAKETVAAMEQGTVEVVESGKLQSRAMSALRDAEKDMSSALVEVPRLSRDIERQALSSADTVSMLQGVSRGMGEAATDAGKAQEVFGQVRSMAGKIVRLIEQGATRSLWRRD